MAIIKPKLHHVTLKTTRLQEMIDWYGIVIGGEVTYVDPRNAWMTNDDANHRIAFLVAPGLHDDEAKTSHNGMHHSAFEYDSFDDLMTSYKRLKDEGIEPAFSLEHGLTTSLYYGDPEGNFVELQSDAFGDWALSTRFMQTSASFAANPIGYFFDPEGVYQAHLAGAEFSVLQAAIRREEYLPAKIPEMGLPVSEPVA